MVPRAMVGCIGWMLLGSSTANAGHPPPVALVVPQVGLQPIAYSTLLTELSARGIRPVLLTLPITPEQLVMEVLPEERARHPSQPVAVIGHGYGGRALLDWAGLSTTCGVALLGTPLMSRPSPWHADLPSAAEHIAGVSLRTARTEDAPGVWPITRVQSGYPTAWLGRVSSDWLRYIRDTLYTPASLPVAPDLWLGVAPLDELGPPESLGPNLPETATVRRWGMLRGWRHGALAADLLTDPRITADLTAWIHQTCS